MKPQLTSDEQDLAEHWIKELTSPVIELSTWELGFLESVSDQFESTRQLSSNQFEKLKSIYETKS